MSLEAVSGSCLDAVLPFLVSREALSGSCPDSVVVRFFSLEALSGSCLDSAFTSPPLMLVLLFNGLQAIGRFPLVCASPNQADPFFVT